MLRLGSPLANLRPTRGEWVLFGLLWLKFLAFFVLVFNCNQLNFSLTPLNDEIFRSFLRPVYVSVVILFLLAIPGALKPRWKTTGFVVLSLVLGVILLADLWYYRAFKSFPSMSTLSAYRGVPLTPAWVLPFTRWTDAAVFLDLPILAALRLGFPLEAPWGARRLLGQGAVFAGLFCLVSPVGGHVLNSQSARKPLSIYDPMGTSITVTPLGYHTLDLLALLTGNGARFADLAHGDQQRIADWLDRNQEGLPPGPFHGRLAGKNLLIIQVESLEYFVLDQKVNGVAITPTLNALKDRGLCFSHFHEQVRVGVSSDADLMTNASVLPMGKDPTFVTFPTTTLPSMPRLLAARGYATTSIHPDPGSFWNCREGLVSLGFERCLDSGSFDCSDSFGMGLSDASYFNQAVPVIKAMKRPFYVFMVTQSSHLPFNLPDYLRDLPLEPELDDHIMGGYLQSVHYTDKHLGLFLESLRREGILDDTVVVVTGDHQGVHKYCQDALRTSPFAQAWWEDRERRIPFLVLAKGLDPTVVDVHGGQVDIMPTLLDLLGVDPGEWGRRMMGRNLLNTRRNTCVLGDGSLAGDPGNRAAAAHGAEGLEIADLIIRSNYFGRTLSAHRAPGVEERDVDRQQQP